MSNTLKARLPRGFVDRPAADLAATERMLDAIRRTYRLYGFEALETPFVEYTEALGKFLPDQDRPNEGVFSFQDDDEQWLSLRYDLTAPLARHVAERLDQQSLTLPYRSYRAGWVFRNEKPGPGRFRQFMQFDADTVGSASPAADAEICMMMADTLEAVGIPRGQYVVKVNNRKVLDGVMEAVGLGGAENAGRRLTVLRALDKYDRLGIEGVRLLLGPGRKDESGDFTKGAGLGEVAVERLLVFVGGGESSGGGRRLDALRAAVGDSAAGLAGIDDLAAIERYFEAAGYGDGRIVIDPTVVRGLEYYTGPVFEAELTFSITNDEGQTVRFGSVAGGGRYDGLVGRFRAEPVPATGFSIGVSRLLAALQHVGSPLAASGAHAGPAVVLVMDRDRIADYQEMVSKLRLAGIPAELYLGSAGMKAQMKYADRRKAPCVVIQGSQEKEKGEVQIKDLIQGTERAVVDAAASNAEYRAARLAQISVSEQDLVAEVGKIFDRHGLR
ncbi:histidine--tRNA ligase [Enterovirga sp.]|uniref:histidine--tRNA ligase n=1 Tax=Enterovirga sp. TaxID=2026350 RepID=UPI002C9584D7|nr:histidine--tRNA ligase [Enterovirga sp.]HMO28657.1 histidine--tRNA ligase [Enterovirga sp.]